MIANIFRSNFKKRKVLRSPYNRRMDPFNLMLTTNVVVFTIFHLFIVHIGLLTVLFFRTLTARITNTHIWKRERNTKWFEGTLVKKENDRISLNAIYCNKQ